MTPNRNRTSPSDPQTEVIALLEHYTDVSMHHRTVMLGFGSVYFAITQLLALSQAEKSALLSSPVAPAALASGALLMLLILAAVLHHASGFCMTAALKATMLMNIHYKLLPHAESDIDLVHRTINAIAKEAKAFSQSRTVKSVHIVVFLFTMLFLSNSYLFWQTCKEIVARGGPEAYISLGGSLIGLLIFGYYYSALFRNHFSLLVASSEKLGVVLDSTTKSEADRRLAESKAR